MGSRIIEDGKVVLDTNAEDGMEILRAELVRAEEARNDCALELEAAEEKLNDVRARIERTQRRHWERRRTEKKNAMSCRRSNSEIASKTAG